MARSFFGEIWLFWYMDFSSITGLPVTQNLAEIPTDNCKNLGFVHHETARKKGARRHVHKRDDMRPRRAKSAATALATPCVGA
jgi:hypothetical protein